MHLYKARNEDQAMLAMREPVGKYKQEKAKDIRMTSVYCLLSAVNCWRVDKGSADSRS